jgi:hypothetical protein
MGEVFVKSKRKTTRGDKVRISLYLDPTVVAYYKAQAEETGYQALINDTLRAAMQQRDTRTLAERVEAVYGRYAHIQTSSDEFAERKQQEIEHEG